MMFRHPHAPGGHGPNGTGPIVAGCDDCNSPEAIAARRARRDLERGTATFAAPERVSQHDPRTGRSDRDEIDDRPGADFTRHTGRPDCPCEPCEDERAAYGPTDAAADYRADAPAGAGDSVEAFRG